MINLKLKEHQLLITTCIFMIAGENKFGAPIIGKINGMVLTNQEIWFQLEPTFIKLQEPVPILIQTMS